MTAQPVPAPPFSSPLLSGGTISNVWQSWLMAVWTRIGGMGDKVEAAFMAASAAAPASAEVVASGGLQAGGPIGPNVGIALYVAMTDVASLPSAGINIGDWAYALDGLKPGEATGAGTGVPVFRSGAGWISACNGAAVSA